MSLTFRQRVFAGLKWTTIAQFSSQGINFAVSIILARLLLPEEFGLVAMFTILMGIASVIVEGGLSSSLIRTKDPSNAEYSTVFLFNLVAGCCMYILFFIAAPHIASWYNQPDLRQIIRVYSVIFIITGFSQIQNTQFTKKLDFKQLFKISLPSLIISGSIGIALAYSGYGVWSLVYMNLARAFLGALQLWFYSDWRPDLVFNKVAFKKHFGFGYKLTLTQMINKFFERLIELIIGKHFPAAQLGFYSRANSLKEFPINNFNAIVTKVAFPMMAEIKDDIIRLRSILRKSIIVSVFVITPILLTLAVLAEPFFSLLLTDKWLPAVQYFQILCLAGVLSTTNNYNLTALNVLGKSHLYLKLETINKVCLVLFILVGYYFGIDGLVYSMVVYSISSFIINATYSGRLLNYSRQEQLKDILPILLLSSLSATLAYILDSYLEQSLSDILRLLTGISCSMVIYITLSFVFYRSILMEIIPKEVWTKRTRKLI